VRGTVFDIRERREAERAQRIAHRRLAAESRRAQEATRMKSEFLANMSHELRTPLNAVIGFAELLHDGKAGRLGADQREYVGDILASGRHLLQLINDVLDLAKVEAGRVEFRPERVDLATLLAQGRDLLRALAARKRLTVEVRVDPEAGQVFVDPARLKQVLYNFLSNAIKFTAEGGRIRVTTAPEGRDSFRLAVEDTGSGIAAADLPRLFTEFQQLDGGLAKRHQGTGLGLSLTRKLVEAQGGRVGVTSTPGRGSVFYAVLPRRAEGVAGDGRAVAPRASGVRVLVVEDDDEDRGWLVRELDRAGYSVDAVGTGAEALERCRRERYAAITLDLILPDRTGWEILKSVRRDGPNQDTPVVVLSLVSEREAGPALHVHDHLVKPVRTEDLLAALQTAGAPPDVHGIVLRAGSRADELVATLDRCAAADLSGGLA
jgi:CheY-like chemotaxis protein/nitrogen-specific signal transduction histidine kinase